MTSTPAAVLPVVPFFTVPCSSPARAETAKRSRAAQGTQKLRSCLIADHAPSPPFARRADGEPVIPSLGRFPSAPAPLRFQEQSSSRCSRLRNIFQSETQNASLANCRRSYLAVPSIGPAWSGAAPDQKHPAECRKQKAAWQQPAQGKRRAQRHPRKK